MIRYRKLQARSPRFWQIQNAVAATTIPRGLPARGPRLVCRRTPNARRMRATRLQGCRRSDALHLIHFKLREAESRSGAAEADEVSGALGWVGIAIGHS